jgi:hypothetical protein
LSRELQCVQAYVRVLAGLAKNKVWLEMSCSLEKKGERIDGYIII